MIVRSSTAETTANPQELSLAQRFGLEKSKIVEILLVSAIFLVLTGVLTYPWLLNFKTHALGWPGDNFHYIFKFWWYKHSLIDDLSLFNSKTSLFFAPDIFYPFGYNLAMTEMTPANIVPYLPLVVIFGEIVTYNIVVLLSYVLSGVGMYLLIKYLTGKGYAGILSGIIFAFSPYHMMHSLGHLPLLSIQWIPFMFLYAEKTIREKKPSAALLTGIFYALLVLSSWYYAIMLGLALGAYLLLRIKKPWAKVLNPRAWLLAFWFVLPSLLFVVPFMIPYLRLSKTGNMDWKLYLLKGAPPIAYFLPAALHPFLGKYAIATLTRNSVEDALYVGIVPTLLAAFAYFKRRNEKFVRVSFWMILIFFVLSLGPFLADGSKKLVTLKLEAPEAMTTAIALPGLLLTYLPFVSSIREFTRFGIIVTFFVSALAGLGFAALTNSLKANRKAIALGLTTIVIAFEFLMVPYPLSKIEARPVDKWFSEQKGDFVLFAYPFDSALKNPQMYYTKTHGKKIAYGRGTFMPPEFLAQKDTLATLPSKEALAVLRSWKVTHVVVDTKLISKGNAKAIAQSPDLYQIKKFDNLIVYGLRR